jgi:copper chaperone
MAEHQYKFNVSMSCGGCSGAVERVLKKLDGKFKSLILLFDRQIKC